MFLLYGDDAGSANKRHLVIGGLGCGSSMRCLPHAGQAAP